MRSINKLPFKNLIKKPARTAALLVLSVFLAFSVFGGSVVVMSLQRGLDSLQARLGADIIAVPDKAKNDLEAILIQGVPGYFYMNRENVDKIAAVDGVETVSPQYFLATMTAGCCSMPVQIIGFDPETDFSVQPWVKKSYDYTLEEGDVLAGSDINAEVGENLRFFGCNVHVAAKLENTGTELDNAIFTNSATIKMLMSAAQESGLTPITKNDPDSLVSSVLIKVKEGYDISQVADHISGHVRKVTAVRTQSMISGIEKSLAGVSDITGFLIAAVWVLCLLVMMIAFSMIINERRREFAVLRVLGASKARLAGIVLAESLMIGLAGGVTGVLLACLLVFPFSGLIELRLGLPFLMPGIDRILAAALLSVLVSVLAGPLTSAMAAVRVSRIDTGLILREGN